MTRSTIVARAAAMLGAAALTVAALAGVPAEAAPSGMAQQPPPSSTQTLVLSITTLRTSVAYLTCNPPGGDHPQAQAACDAIRAVGGDIHRLPDDPRFDTCTGMANPRVATAFGWWGARPIWFSNFYMSPCDLWHDTGLLFMFADHVPPADAAT